MMKVAVISATPETHHDLGKIIRDMGMHSDFFSWDDLKTSTEKIKDHAVYFILDEVNKTHPAISFMKEQNQQGKILLGMEKGANMIIESGIVPGLENDKVGIHINETHESEKIVDIQLIEEAQFNAFTRCFTPEDHFAVTKKSATFLIPPALKIEMQMQGLLLFQYEDTIAAISNKAGNAMASLPKITEKKLFQSMVEHIKSGLIRNVTPLYYYPRHVIFN